MATWIEEDLQGDDRLAPETAERLALLRGRVKRMEALILGILEYSRVGRMAAEIETVRLADLLREVVEMLAPPDSIRVETQGSLPTFETKRVRLQQVLSNLIGNAVKYHDKDQGKVVVTVKQDGEWLHFELQAAATSWRTMAPESLLDSKTKSSLSSKPCSLETSWRALAWGWRW